MMQNPVFVGLIMWCLAASVHAGGVYKWVDKDGNVHFGDQPTDGHASQIAQPKTQVPSDPVYQERLQRQKQYLNARAEEREQAKQKAEEAKIQKAERQAKCQKAKEQLAYLEAHARLYATLPNGEQKYLTAEEREAELAKMRQQIAEFCS